MRRTDVLAIDPSLTGFVMTIATYGEADQTVFLASKPPKIKTLRARIDRYLKMVEDTLKVAESNCPRLILIEGYSYQSKGQAVISLGEFGALLRDKLINIPDVMVEVAPTSLKKFASGKGNASKIEVATALTKKYGLEFKNDGHADSFGLARLGMCVLNSEQAATKAQQQVVSLVQQDMQKEMEYSDRN